MSGSKKARGLLVLYRDSHTPPPHPKRTSRTKKPRESRPAKRERLAQLATQPVPTLFQHNPYKTNRSQFPAKSYTENIGSFCEMARKRKTAIVRNLKMTGRSFSHLVTINLYEQQHPDLINPVFNAFAKNLGTHGLDGHWTIEVNKKNFLHWHLLFLNFKGNPSQLKQLLTRYLKDVQFPRFRVEVECRKHKNRNLLDYCLKVLKPGYKSFDAEDGDLGNGPVAVPVPDLYKDKRVLFAKKTGFDKHGTFGKFWAPGWSHKKFREVIKQETAAVEKNIKDPRVLRLVEHLHQKLGIRFNDVKWAYALDPYTPEIEAMMAALEESSEEPAAPHKPIPKKTGRRRPSRTKAVRRQTKASDLVRSVFGAKTTRRTRRNRPSRSRTRHSIPRPLFNNSRNFEISIFRSGLRVPSPSDIRLPRGHSP